MDIIVDIDGTLANIEHRLHFIRDERAPPSTRIMQSLPRFKPNWDAFFDACDQDEPICTVIAVVHSLRTGTASPIMDNRLLFATGRVERVRAKTARWLLEQNFIVDQPDRGSRLYMRRDGDTRPDHVVKLEMLAQMRRDGYSPVVAIDDRQQVVDMWRREGLLCMQVADGKY